MSPVEVGVIAGQLAAGFVLWTLVEYCGHRWLMHSEMGPRFIRRSHAQHHRDPLGLTWRDSIAFGGSFLLALAGVAALGAIVFGRSSLLLATGVGIGSIAYSLSHRYAHSETFTPDARSRFPWNAHLRHHNLDARANFGFTTVFWDRVFGTIGERPLVAPEG